MSYEQQAVSTIVIPNRVRNPVQCYNYCLLPTAYRHLILHTADGSRIKFRITIRPKTYMVISRPKNQRH